MTRQRSLAALLVSVAAAATGVGLATCSVERGRYHDQVYSCDVRQTDPAKECGVDWVCHPGSQLGTYDFCAPACTPGGGEQYCSPDGALLQPCDPSAPACGTDLQCLRTSVTSNQGLCLPVEVCGKDDECRDPLRSQCLSQVLADGYGPGLDPGMLNNMWCLQGNCNELSPCEAGHSCLGGLPMLEKVPAMCAPNCGRRDLCPRSFVCATKVLASLPYRFCLPGLFGFPCENDDQCLIGTCQPMGSHGKACTVACTTDADCSSMYRPVDAAKAGVACFGGQCITAFSVYMQLLCDPRDNRCADDAECLTAQAITDAGVPGEVAIGEAYCRKQCTSPADCKSTGTATSCMNLLGYTACVPGVASTIIECDPTDPDACVKGLECRQPALGKPYCTIACEGDAQCQTHPWLTPSWRCRGTAGSQLCAP